MENGRRSFIKNLSLGLVSVAFFTPLKGAALLVDEDVAVPEEKKEVKVCDSRFCRYYDGGGCGKG